MKRKSQARRWRQPEKDDETSETRCRPGRRRQGRRLLGDGGAARDYRRESSKRNPYIGPRKEPVMEPAYVSAVAALAGSALGGFTSLTASWLTQRTQVQAERLAHDIARREELYKDFVEDASKCYADAIEHNEIDVTKVVRLYALVSRMRILSSLRVVEQADAVMHMIMERYAAPNITIRDLAEDLHRGGLDPLRNFSAVCRDEFRTQSATRLDD
jgi:hypothetical protein